MSPVLSERRTWCGLVVRDERERERERCVGAWWCVEEWMESSYDMRPVMACAAIIEIGYRAELQRMT